MCALMAQIRFPGIHGVSYSEPSVTHVSGSRLEGGCLNATCLVSARASSYIPGTVPAVQPARP